MNANLGLGNKNKRNNSGCCMGNNYQRRTMETNYDRQNRGDQNYLEISNKDDNMKNCDCGCNKNMNSNMNDCGCDK